MKRKVALVTALVVLSLCLGGLFGMVVGLLIIWFLQCLKSILSGMLQLRSPNFGRQR